MNIGSALFAQLSTEGFSRVRSEIVTLQERISSGQRDLSPSADPARAIKFSAGQEMLERIDRFSENARSAVDRLSLADSVLSEVADITAQLRQIALSAANGPFAEEKRSDLAQEVVTLRQSLINAANTRDSFEQPLFAGYATGEAFRENPEGRIIFGGDIGKPMLRVSENMLVPTSLNGADVFSHEGYGLFGAVDDMLVSLQGGGGKSASAHLSAFESSSHHIAAQRAEVGALANMAERQIDALFSRKADLDTSMSRLSDLDITEAVTRLQTLLTTQEAAQQTYVRIQSRTLFDYIR